MPTDPPNGDPPDPAGAEFLGSFEFDFLPTLTDEQRKWPAVQPDAASEWLGSYAHIVIGAELLPALRRRVAMHFLGDPSTIAIPDPQLVAARLRGVLQKLKVKVKVGEKETEKKVKVFGRTWFTQILPPEPPPEKAMLAEQVELPTSADKASLPRPEQDRFERIWQRVGDQVWARGRKLYYARRMDWGLEAVMGAFFSVVAKNWAKFQERSEEETIRWFVCILNRLCKRYLVHNPRQLPDDDALQQLQAKVVPTLPSITLKPDRDAIATRLKVLHAQLPAEGRIDDLDDRILGLKSLQLVVPADTIETILQFDCPAQLMWSMLTVRRVPDLEVAEALGISVGNMRVQFTRLRKAALKRLTACWAPHWRNP